MEQGGEEMSQIEFIVHGEPRPKGSKNAFVVNWPHGKDKRKVAQRIKGIASKLLAQPFSWRPVTTVSEVSKGLANWEKAVREAAEIAMASNDGPMHCPIRLTMIFFIQRPKSHYGTGKNADVIKERYQKELPTKVPDLSKLFRAAEDGLNGVVFNDDSQVVEMVSKKFFGRRNGVRIIVDSVDHHTVTRSDPEQLLLFKTEDL